jgi:hypothetical protein
MTLETALRSFERWKTIQRASILPLLLCTVWIFYFRIASECGIMVFIYILTVGVLIPEVKGDLTETHISIREELDEQRMELRQLLREETQQLLKDSAIRNLLKENPDSSEEQTRF